MKKLFLIIKGWPLVLKLMWGNNFLIISSIILGKIYYFESIYITGFLALIQMTMFFLMHRKIKKERIKRHQRIEELTKKIEDLKAKKEELIQIGKEIEQLRFRMQILKQFENQNLN